LNEGYVIKEAIGVSNKTALLATYTPRGDITQFYELITVLTVDKRKKIYYPRKKT
jgi:hypothetical protein